MSKLPTRKQNRLSDYDYSSNGYYHLTICSADKKNIFSKIIRDDLYGYCSELTEIGNTVDQAINDIELHYNTVCVHRYMIMPNHIHLLVSIDRGPFQEKASPTVSDVVKGMKTAVTKKLGQNVFQSSFYDHVVKNEKDLENVITYIEQNPQKWEDDEYYM